MPTLGPGPRPSAGAGGCLGRGRCPKPTAAGHGRRPAAQQALGRGSCEAAERGARGPGGGGRPPGGTAGAELGVPAGGGDGCAGDTARLLLALPREWLPGSKMESASRAGQEISLAALKQHDPYITSIADVTGQVALYSFSPKANEWVSPEERAGLSPRPGRAGPGGGGGAAPGRAFAAAGRGGAGAPVARTLAPAAAWPGTSAGAPVGGCSRPRGSLGFGCLLPGKVSAPEGAWAGGEGRLCLRAGGGGGGTASFAYSVWLCPEQLWGSRFLWLLVAVAGLIF